MDSEDQLPQGDERHSELVAWANRLPKGDLLRHLEYAYLPAGSDEPVPCDLVTFQLWWDKEPEWYYKKQDRVGDFLVATRFTGIETHFRTPPEWWEVSVERCDLRCQDHRSFATLEAALKRHAELVEALQAGVLEGV